MEKKRVIQYLLSVLIFLGFIGLAYYVNVKEYVLDSVMFIILITLLQIFYKKFNLDSITYWLLVLGMVLHNFGVLGWYGKSPFIIQYDHLTHLIGFIGIGSLFSGYVGRNYKNWFERLVVILVLSAGVGAFIELIEFVGYLKLGIGEGFLYYGGLGDTGVNLRAMDAIGGGWINTMLDLVYNTLGSLIGVIIFYLKKKLFQ